MRLLLWVILAFSGSTLAAATFTVTNTNDSGAGSLRQAILDANANSGPDNVVFNLPTLPATITTLSFIRTIGTVTITGPGARQLTISAGAASFQGFIIGQFSTNPANSMPSDATFQDLTITGYTAAGAGGAFNLQNTSHSGTLSSITLNRVAVRNCQMSSGSGGVVSVGTGTFRATDCEFTSCAATGSGGAINNSGGTLILTNCTFSGNSSSVSGGAINGSGVLNSCTISGNTAAQAGGGINASGTLTLINTIIAGNTSTAQTSEDIAGTFTSLGYNCIQVTTGATFTPQATDITGQDPLLSALANNGGPTNTMAIAATSPAIDAGTSSSGALTTDQRGTGFDRTFNDVAVTNADDGTDIGAFERQPIPTPTISPGGSLGTFVSTGVAVASTEQNFTVAGTNLTQPITIAPPQHWEVSFATGGPYAAFPSTISTAAPSAGSIATTTVYIRYNPTATPPHSDFITLTSAGATPASVAVSGALPTATPSGFDFAAAEGTPATNTAVWRLTLSSAVTAPLVVSFNVGSLSTPAASPLPGVDFNLSTPTSGAVVNFVGATGNTITVPAGTSIVDILLTPIDDIVVESTENVNFTVATGSGYSVGSGNAFVNISDNDVLVTPTATVAATDNTAEEGNAANTGVYTVSFSQTPNAVSTTINFTMSGTASTVGGTDYNLSVTPAGVSVIYTGPTGTLVVPAGTASVTVIVTAANDSQTEGNETAIFTLNTGTDYVVGTPSDATVTILDDDIPVVTLAVTDDTADEGNAATDIGEYTITLSPASTVSTSISFTMSGTAVGTDYSLAASTGSLTYTFPNGTLVLAAGTTSVIITLTAMNDALVEGATPETATLTINANAAAYSLGATVTGTVDILDDDIAVVPTITVSATDDTASEANAATDTGTYQILISPAPNTPLTIQFSMGGTAAVAANVDYALSATGGTLGYTAPNGLIDIAIGTTSVLVTLTSSNDLLAEGATPETAILTLVAAAGYTIGTAANATINVLDDDTPPEITVAATGVNATEATPATSPGEYTITFTPPANAAIVLNFSMGGTASTTSGTDYSLSVTGGALAYTGPDGTISVAAGTASVVVTVTVAEDTLPEGATPETAILTLGAGTGYTLGTAVSATVSIADNDTVPVAISTTSLANGEVNDPYSAVITATGGAAPFVWTVAAGSTLPPGLSLAASATNSTTLSGTPTAAGSYGFDIEVSGGGTSDTQTFALTIGSPSVGGGGGGGGSDGGGCRVAGGMTGWSLLGFALLALAARARRRRA